MQPHLRQIQVDADQPAPRASSGGPKPPAAHQRLKGIKVAFAWAKEAGLIAQNPSRDARSIKTNSGGHHTWTTEEVERFKVVHPLGTTAHLAISIMLLTGVRRSDAVKLGRQHEGRDADGHRTLSFTATKNQGRSPARVTILLLPELHRVLDESKTGSLTYLITSFGRSFSAKGFGNAMRAWCDQAGLPEYSSHGLRKAAATAMADNGASEHQLMSVFGWLTAAEAQRYTCAASRKTLAASGALLLVRR